MNESSTINLITACWIGGLGACIGSFLNVVAYRLPLGMSVVWKGSHCPKCGHAIRARDNVPVFGWLWLNGRCRDCQEPISARYAIVELVMGVAFFVLVVFELFTGGANLPQGPITSVTGAWQTVWQPQWQLIGVVAYHALLLSLLMCVTLIDRDGQKVPRKLVGFGLVVGVGLSVCFTFLQLSLPLIAEDGPTYSNGFLGVALGWVLGATGGKFLCKDRNDQSELNLQVGLMLVGAFLGWQGVVAMMCVLLFGGVTLLLLGSESQTRTSIYLLPVVLGQLVFWKRIAETVF